MQSRDRVARELCARGLKPSSARAAASALRALLKRTGLRLESASDADLARAVGEEEGARGKPRRPEAARVFRHRIASALRAVRKDAELRWPSVAAAAATSSSLGAGRRTPTASCPTPTACLPRGAFVLPESHPVRRLFVRLYGELVRLSDMRSALSVRAALSFLYGFLCSGAPGSLVQRAASESEEGLARALASQTEDSLVRAYHAYHEHGGLLRRSVQLGTLTRHLHLISVVFCDVLRVPGVRRHLSVSSFGIFAREDGRRGRRRQRGGGGDDDDDGAATRSSRSTTTTAAAAAFFDVLFGKSRVPFDMRAQWLHAPRDHSQHVFSAGEVRALYLACETLFEKLLLTALFTTGMRRQGFARALMSGTASSSRVVGTEWVTTEKRGRRAAYDVGPVLRALLQAWVDGGCGGHAGEVYVFPSRRRGLPQQQQPISTQTVYRAFMAVARRAGVAGAPHCHPHTTRHTVAWTLAALGNKVEDVAAFVGHKDPQVTQAVYIAMSRAQTVSRMTCPWLRSSGGAGEPCRDVQTEGYELASALASPFGSEDQRTFPSFLRPPPRRTSKEGLRDLALDVMCRSRKILGSLCVPAAAAVFPPSL